MSKEKIEINVTGDTKELIIREGSALPVKEPKVVSIDGTIQAPAEFLKKRKTEIESKNCHVLFSYENMYIKFVLDEKNAYASQITGKLLFNQELEKFGINSKKTWTKTELKTFLKMNRAFFKNVDENYTIVMSLEKFSAKVQAQIDDQQDNRGNAKKGVEIKVDTDLAMKFTLFMPVFLGQPSKSFEIEICFDIRDNGLTIWLESPELQELIIKEREALIDSNKADFLTDFVVIQQ